MKRIMIALCLIANIYVYGSADNVNYVPSCCTPITSKPDGDWRQSFNNAVKRSRDDQDQLLEQADQPLHQDDANYGLTDDVVNPCTPTTQSPLPLTDAQVSAILAEQRRTAKQGRSAQPGDVIKYTNIDMINGRVVSTYYDVTIPE